MPPSLRAVVAASCSVTLAINASRYNASQMVPYSLWSSAAYCSEKQIADWSCQACDLAPKPVAITVVQNATLSAYGFVAKQPDGSITVAFRGSSNLRNWIANVDFVKKPYPGCAGCEVHGGFQDIYTEVSAQMLRAIDSYGGKSVTAIHLTGHSLGAAIGTLAFVDLYAAGYPVDANINFGSPRVGNPAWAAYYNALVDDSTGANATAARDALRVQIGTSGDLAAAGAADEDLPANVTMVPRWSAVQLAAVASAMGGAAARGVALSPAEVSAVRAVMSAARAGGRSLPPATLRTAAAALARLPVAAINQAALAHSLPAAPAPPVSFRLVHHHDIVPHLGPEDLGFEHGIEEVWLAEDQASWATCSTATGEDHACCWSVPVLEYSVADHLDYNGVQLLC